MAYIITSKTRSKIMKQPQERQKFMAERRAITFQKHAVETISPLQGFSEMDIHEELDKQGSGIKESMIANQELQEANRKIKRAAEAPMREKIIKERVEKLEERDRKNGRLKQGQQFQEQSKKRRKK